jgi:peptide/nickel transport system permease protein
MIVSQNEQALSAADGATAELIVGENRSGKRLLSRIAPRWVRLLLSNRRARIGLLIIGFFIFIAIFGRLIFHGNPLTPDYSGLPEQAPSARHWLGTDQQSHDIFRQLIYGTRPTLILGFSIGAIATTIAIIIGMTAGYFGGVIDELLSLLMNIFLVLPTIPLMIVLAAWLQVRSDLSIIVVISLTSWAFGARVFRSQTLSLREREFALLAVVRGESRLRVALVEILPNMMSLVVSGLIGTTVFAIGTAAGLQFIGLGNVSEVNWFTVLYWAQNTSSLETGAWWTFVPAGLAIALFGMGCTFVNYGIDQISNPRLEQARKELRPSLLRRPKSLARSRA